MVVVVVVVVLVVVAHTPYAPILRPSIHPVIHIQNANTCVRGVV